MDWSSQGKDQQNKEPSFVEIAGYKIMNPISKPVNIRPLVSTEWQPLLTWWHPVAEMKNGKPISTLKLCKGKEVCHYCHENGNETENKKRKYPFRGYHIVPNYMYGYDEVIYIRQFEDTIKSIMSYIYSGNPDLAISVSGVGQNRRTVVDPAKGITNPLTSEKHAELLKSLPDQSLFLEKLRSATEETFGYFGQHTKSPGVNTIAVLNDILASIKRIPGDEMVKSTKFLTSLPVFESGVTDLIEKLKAVQPEPQKAPEPVSNQSGKFLVPVGSYKGLTLEEIWGKDQSWFKTVSDCAQGEFKCKIDEFLKSKGYTIKNQDEDIPF